MERKSDKIALVYCLGAIEDAIPCLTDWIKTTGFGEANKRDKLALVKCLMAIEYHHQLLKTEGYESPGLAPYAEQIKLTGYVPKETEQPKTPAPKPPEMCRCGEDCCGDPACLSCH